MNRIPILIQGAFLQGSASVVSGGIEYTLTWNEADRTLELRNSTDSSVQSIELTGLGSGGGGSSELLSTLTVSKDVGGIVSGTSYPAGTSLEVLLRDVLDPVVMPTFVAPSATLTAADFRLLEVGATLNTNMTIAFNRGSISTGGNRSGAATEYVLNGGTSQTSNVFNVTVSESNKTFQASVSYGEGDQPKDSKGNNVGDPLGAGSVNTNTVTYEFVDAIWSNTANIETIAKEPLVSKSAKQKQFNFPAQTVSDPEIFDVPASWNVTTVEVLNTLSGQWQNAASEFSVSDVTHGSTQYKRYTYNVGIGTGARSVRIKWTSGTYDYLFSWNAQTHDLILNEGTDDEQKLRLGNVAFPGDIPDVSGFAVAANLAAVATSGDFNDLENKPAAYDDSALVARVSALEQSSGNVDLSDYYTKGETDAIVSTIKGMELKPVPTLPTQDIEENVIYLVKDSLVDGDLYSEYVYVDGAWEKFGTARIDLSNYYTKDEVDTAIANVDTSSSAAQDADIEAMIDDVFGNGGGDPGGGDPGFDPNEP